MANTLPIEALQKYVRYEPDTGIVRWNGRGRLRDGRIAGTPDKDGYLFIKIGGRRFPLHRIAFALHHGYWPEVDIDHEDGDRQNNRASNLREATRTQNNANSKMRVNNTSGLKGVHWHAAARKWRAMIRVDRKSKCLGLFDDKYAAQDKFLAAARELYGDFCPKGAQLCASLTP